MCLIFLGTTVYLFSKLLSAIDNKINKEEKKPIKPKTKNGSSNS